MNKKKQARGQLTQPAQHSQTGHTHAHHQPSIQKINTVINQKKKEFFRTEKKDRNKLKNRCTVHTECHQY